MTLTQIEHVLRELLYGLRRRLRGHMAPVTLMAAALFVFGLLKKVVLADRLAQIANPLFASDQQLEPAIARSSRVDESTLGERQSRTGPEHDNPAGRGLPTDALGEPANECHRLKLRSPLRDWLAALEAFSDQPGAIGGQLSAFPLCHTAPPGPPP